MTFLMVYIKPKYLFYIYLILIPIDSFSNLELPLLEELIKNDVSVQFDYLIPVNGTNI